MDTKENHTKEQTKSGNRLGTKSELDLGEEDFLGWGSARTEAKAVGGGMSKNLHRQLSSDMKSCFPYSVSCTPVSTHCSLPISGSCWREWEVLG